MLLWTCEEQGYHDSALKSSILVVMAVHYECVCVVMARPCFSMNVFPKLMVMYESVN